MNTRGSPAALAELEERLATDLRPVRAFQPDRACALVVALGFGVGLGVLWPWLGLRPDANVLGPQWLWGPTALSVTIGAVLISLALRRVIPGNLPSYPALVTSAILGLVVWVLPYLAVYARSPVVVPPDKALRIGLLCVGMEVCLGAPAMLLLLWLAHRGIAVEPMPAAIVGAFGVSLVSDSVWRLICQYSHPAHVATSHGPGMVVVVLVGVGLVYLWDRRQLGQ